MSGDGGFSRSEPKTEAEIAPPAAEPRTASDFVALETYMRQLRPLLTPEVTELCINRPNEVWSDTPSGWVRHDAPGISLQFCQRLAKLIANAAGEDKSISTKSPIMSAALPTRERVQVLFPPACSPGTVCITIRKPTDLDLSLDDYAEAGLFDDVDTTTGGIKPHEQQLLELKEGKRIREFFALAIATRQTIVVSGATGSGKTTFMKALIKLIPPDERLISIEDTPELVIKQPNHVHLFYNKSPTEHTQHHSASALLEASMRLTPHRILPAELRDSAAYNFLNSANTGHPGPITSTHANSPEDAIERIADLASGAPAAQNRSYADMTRLVRKVIDVVAHFERVGGKRRLTGLYYDPEKRRTAAS